DGAADGRARPPDRRERRPPGGREVHRQPGRRGRAGRHLARRVRGQGRRVGRRHQGRQQRQDQRRHQGGEVTDMLTPVLTAHWGTDRSWTLASYESVGGYQALDKALAMEPSAVIEEVKDSGLRGRGGAGFPTGMKWGFIPQDNPKPKYLVVNADESEPGTCKDIPLMMASPHTLVEGVIISSYAIRANKAFIYIRG